MESFEPGDLFLTHGHDLTGVNFGEAHLQNEVVQLLRAFLVQACHLHDGQTNNR